MKNLQRNLVWLFLRYDNWRDNMFEIRQSPSNEFHKMCTTDMQRLSHKRLKKLLMAAGVPRDIAEDTVATAARHMPLANYWCVTGWSLYIPTILSNDWKRELANKPKEIKNFLTAIYGDDPTSGDVDDAIEELNRFFDKHPDVTDIKTAREYAESAMNKFLMLRESSEGVDEDAYNAIQDEAYLAKLANAWFEFAGFLPGYGLTE